MRDGLTRRRWRILFRICIWLGGNDEEARSLSRLDMVAFTVPFLPPTRNSPLFLFHPLKDGVKVRDGRIELVWRWDCREINYIFGRENQKRVPPDAVVECKGASWSLVWIAW